MYLHILKINDRNKTIAYLQGQKKCIKKNFALSKDKRYKAAQEVEKSIQHYINIYANNANGGYTMEMGSFVSADLRSSICGITESLKGDSKWEENPFAVLEQQSKIRIMIEATMSKAGFIPLRFPEICTQDLMHAPLFTATGCFDLKTKGIFEDACVINRICTGDASSILSMYSQDLTTQTTLTWETMDTFINNSDHLPVGKLDSTHQRVIPIVNNLKKLGLGMKKAHRGAANGQAVYGFSRVLRRFENQIETIRG